MSEKIFNPDFKKEALGVLNTLLLFAGMFLTMIGLVLAYSRPLVGNVVWLLATAMIVFSLIINTRQKTGGGFRIANIVMKVLILCFSLMFFLIINFTSK
jgi:hypothetical protein